MTIKNAIGILLCVFIFLTGFILQGNISMYFNLAGAMVVIGGTIGASLVCYRVDQMMITLHVLTSSYRTRVKFPEEIVEILVDLSVKSRFKARKGMGLLLPSNCR